jgi:DNA-binding IclR family transcriptional regulator
MNRRIKSAERTLALFELFAERQVGLTVGVVAHELHMPQPSASMLLHNLTQLGYLEYDRQTRLYSPTIRVMFLGSWISQQFGAVRSFEQVLTDVQRRLDIEIVYIARQNEVSVQYVWTSEANPPSHRTIAPDVPRSLTCTAAGRALLSLKSDQEVVGWVRRSNAEAPDDRLKVSEGRFLSLHDRCRMQGYAETAGDFVPGLGALAVPLQTAKGAPLAISFGGTIDRLRGNHGQILDALRSVRDTLMRAPHLHADQVRPVERPLHQS